MTRILTFLLLLSCSMFAMPAQADRAGRMSSALSETRKGNWTNAANLVRNDGPVERDIIEWHRLRAGEGSYDDVVAFLDRRADWPGLAWLRRKSEPEITKASHARVLEFFSQTPPQTAEGVLSYAAALKNAGHTGDAEVSLVIAWRTMPMDSQIQRAYLGRHRTLLAPHHEARLDRLLWDKHMVSARQMLPLVNKDQQALAEARIALHELAPGVDARIAAVPENLQNSAGLAHGRFEWRIRKGRREDAKTLLLERSAKASLLGEPDKWARRRRDLARNEMREGHERRAYKLASQHYLTDGSDFADLEWLSGFIALRLLNDPTTALAHFQRFDGAVKSPISKGRAGYWIGRAYDALGQPEAAQAAYKDGARYQTSFYGLLAAERGGVPFDNTLQKPPVPPAWKDAAFVNSSVFEAGVLLLAANEPNLGERFLTHLVESLDPVQADQLGQMALDMDRPHLAVIIGKRAARTGTVLPGPYYAVHAVGQMKLPMAAEMNLAIARRESEFDPVVISGAGARGLMQVMPTTAKAVAADLGILSSHSTDRLTSDWRYNAKLGSNYLAGLAGDFDGNIVMMAAGYNAGPGRPTKWIEMFGDPRRGDMDIVDWIEYIPFNETRNYVMRVTESLPVYRARLGGEPLPIPFSEELTGSTLRAFAP